MNRGAINGFALNGRASDPVVRIRVDAKGYARVRAGGKCSPMRWSTRHQLLR